MKSRTSESHVTREGVAQLNASPTAALAWSSSGDGRDNLGTTSGQPRAASGSLGQPRAASANLGPFRPISANPNLGQSRPISANLADGHHLVPDGGSDHGGVVGGVRHGHKLVAAIRHRHLHGRISSRSTASARPRLDLEHRPSAGDPVKEEGQVALALRGAVDILRPVHTLSCEETLFTACRAPP